jgi:acetyl coenzyme A synthetase (ADP forming)-like protein
VILRDGATLRLRPPTAVDADGVLAFFERLSAESMYQRFHGAMRPTPELVQPFLDPNWSERGALVAALGEGNSIVALASYARLRDARSAEVAFAVSDELQGRGIGTRLLEQLVAEASSHGIESFVAVVLPGNRQMLGVFSDAGFETRRKLESGEIEVAFEIVPTAGYQAQVDWRDHVGVTASLTPFFRARTVAVIGASPRPGTIGGELFRNVLRADFSGSVFPVNPSGTPVAGVRAYASVGEIPDEVELAVVCVPAQHVLAAAEDALRHGAKALCVVSAGFAETGQEGKRRQNQLLDLVRAYGARLIGPNCLGIWSAATSLNATFAPRALPPGRIGFSSQSGALGLAMLEKAVERRLGFSGFVSVGNKADVSSNDLLEWWEDDAETDVVLLYLESFGNPRKFGRLARRVARRKPILAMKGGRTGAGSRAAGSHTAALAGSEAAVDALFRQAGVIRAESLEELLDVAGLLSTQPLPRGRRVTVLTNAGGLGILCADACEAAGLELPDLAPATRDALTAVLPREASLANPVDLLGSATAETYESVLPHVAADPNVDALVVLFVPPVVAGAEDVAAAVVRAIDGLGDHDKPVLTVFISGEGIPQALLSGAARTAVFSYPESAARALGRAAERAEWLRRPAGAEVELRDIDRAAVERIVRSTLSGSNDVWLDADAVHAVLAAYGVPLARERVVAGAYEAVQAARELGYPVVVKSAEAGAHKTETGRIALDLRTEDDVRIAAERIGGPVLVQQYVSSRTELLAGVLQDPVFGTLVAFGSGGVFAELIGQAEFRIAPLTDVDALELVTSGKAGTLVNGFRGAPPSDVDALADLVLRLARLAEDFPEIAELDLNPVLGLPSGCVAVDARIRLRPAEPQPQTKTW